MATYHAESAMYNITAVWSIDNPLVTEAIEQITVVLDSLSTGNGIGNREHGRTQVFPRVSSSLLCDVHVHVQ